MKPYVVKVTLNDTPVEMVLDTGAAVSLINKTTYERLCETPPMLESMTTCLRTYSGQQLVVLRTLKVTVKYEARQVVHSIYVVDGMGPSLFGRNLLAVLKLTIQYTTGYPPLNEVLARHEVIFQKELGKAKNIMATLRLEEGTTPKFCNACPVLYSLCEKVERELERLQREGIIESTQFSE